MRQYKNIAVVIEFQSLDCGSEKYIVNKDTRHILLSCFNLPIDVVETLYESKRGSG